ncbi:Response regulator of zinc sigma-54-dependent two-component system [Minicystis rosea]|nr:Response regulator of zinc sigma-54-dependent two-component system [Minicystis rosea]
MLAHRYRVLRVLGRGGLASAILVRDEALGIERCLKLLDDAGADGARRAALRREFQLLAGLSHPNLAAVHDFGVAAIAGGSAFFFTADFVRGLPLPTFAVGKTFAEVRGALLGPLAALAFLHRAGIRHGDVKPENILVDEGRGVLLDLSCAARLAQPAREATVSGTAGFIAPEVMRGEHHDARADLYAFGKVLYAVADVIADRLPDAVAALARRLTEARAELRPSEASEALEALGASANELHVPLREASVTVGRAAEIARGEAALAATLHGAPGARVVVIRGARGSGRSRVLRELKWRAELACTTIEGFPRATEGAVAAMLARALGHTEQHAHGAGLVLTALAEIERRGEPVVLAVDDADRLAPGDREAFELLARSLRSDGPVLLLASESAASSSLGSTATVEAIALEPLSEEAVRAWALDLGIGEAASAILRASGGHAADVAEIAGRVLAGEAACSAGMAARRTRLAAAEASAEAARTPAEVLAAAEALELSGASARALEVLARLDAGAIAIDDAVSLWLRKASCLLVRGEPREALATVERALAEARTPEATARAHDLAARAQSRLGAHGEARARAEAALAIAEAPSQRADLHEAAGIAASYAGDHGAARAHLATAVALHRDLASPRRLVRVLSCQAIDAYRAGELDAAVAGYRRALDVAERGGLIEQIARSSLNLATACHQRGDYAEALRAYERGERVAAALSQEDLLAIFEFDLAKLWADVGAWDRAEHRALRAERASMRVGARFFTAAARSVLGDCALARGDVGEAIARFEAAREGFATEGATREVAEEDLELARARLAAGDIAEARAAIERARGSSIVEQASDLAARASILEGRAALVTGDAATATASFDAAQETAGRAGSLDLLAEALALAGEAERARAIWAPIEALLPEPLRAGFRAHPRRRAVLDRPPPAPAPAAPIAAPPSGEASRIAKLERLIALFRKLNSTLETAEVLGMALDAAIDLTEAERGFIILDEPEKGELHVPVARNVDREKVGKSHLKYSRSIAEQAISTAEPVITVDASADDRFREQRSVHAMRLRSVIAVPIRSPDRVLGALYLDNRFSQARFGREDADLLLAFSDQVALALRNARTLEDLRRRTIELEEERGRVEALARGQAERIEELAEEIRVRQEALEHRHDYRSIIGRGAAMTKLFRTLDRVIDSPLPVLVLGESGTGKELVARAVHYQSGRRAGPFVGVNCAALPATLLESELFGHVKGAFTGADRDRVGLVALARGGTLFLDELGEMPLEVQAKLLRVVQEREVRPVGAASSTPVDFRLVCATNRDLRAEVARGRFREDLYYRVGVVEVPLPPLRDRTEDLPHLAIHFVGRAAENLGRPAPRLSGAAMRKLTQHRWPGNVRELENVITKAVVFASGQQLGPDDIDLPRLAPPARRAAPREDRSQEADERSLILAALARTDWNAALAARDLGMPRATFYRRLTHYGIRRER